MNDHPETPQPSGVFELWFLAPAVILIFLLSAPVLAVLGRTLTTGLAYEGSVWQALTLSLLTSAVSLIITLATGTPLAYLLAKQKFWGKPILELLIDLPLVLPPSVAGLALLVAFGRRGLFGEALNTLGISLPFTTWAVIVAQTFVAAPLYVRAARLGFATVGKQVIESAMVEGASTWQLFRYVMLPLTSRAILSGLVLCWLRALGEFGATILFAGNLEGVTQTMPLAIYLGFERDFNLALALATLLILTSSGLLLGLRYLETTERH